MPSALLSRRTTAAQRSSALENGAAFIASCVLMNPMIMLLSVWTANGAVGDRILEDDGPANTPVLAFKFERRAELGRPQTKVSEDFETADRLITRILQMIDCDFIYCSCLRW